MFVSVLLSHQVILSQSQDKSLRRIGELREVKQNPKYFHFQKFKSSLLGGLTTVSGAT